MTASPLPRQAPSGVAAARKIAIAPATSQFLDMSRWIAAFLVVFSHIRSIVFVNYPDITTHPTVATKAFYFAASFGHQSVVIFFVISGFLVGGRAVLKASERGFSLLDYGIHRFARIYIVLIPALLVGYCLDLAGTSLVDDVGLYSTASILHIHGTDFRWWMVETPISERLGIATLLGNVFCLQTVFVSSLGSNGPLWSLANEWWYYVAFALALSAWLTSTRVSRIICCCGLAILVLVLPAKITIWFALWLLGVGVAPLEQRWAGWPAWVGLVTFVGILCAEHFLPVGSGLVSEFAPDLLLAVAFALALLCAKRGRWAVGNLHPWLASFSYTTYLVHVPAMVLIVATVHRLFHFGIAEQPGLAAAAFMAMLIGFLYLYAWTFAFLTERRTNKVRLWLGRGVAALPVGANPRHGTHEPSTSGATLSDKAAR